MIDSSQTQANFYIGKKKTTINNTIDKTMFPNNRHSTTFTLTRREQSQGLSKEVQGFCPCTKKFYESVAVVTVFYSDCSPNFKAEKEFFGLWGRNDFKESTSLIKA